MNPFKDTVTYWAPSKNDGYGGKVYGTPVQLVGNWQLVQEQFMNPKGELQLSKAIVFFPKSVSAGISIGGYLFLGTSNASAPPSGAQQILQLVVTNDIRRVRKETRAML